MRSIRTYLNALVLAILVPLLALASLLAVDYARVQRRVIEAERVDVISNLRFLLDRELGVIQSTLTTLAHAPALHDGRLEMFRQHAEAALPPGDLFVLSKPDGEVVLTSTDHPSPPARLELDAHMRTVFGGTFHVSGLRRENGPKPGYFMVSVPVVINQKVAYALTAQVSTERLQALFPEADLRPRWIAAIVDPNGALLARNIGADEYLGREVRAEAFDAASGSLQNGSFESNSIEGIRTSNVFDRSAITGWTIFVAVPLQILHRPILEAYKYMAVIGLALTTLGLGLAYLLADRIDNGVKHLTTAAFDVVGGRDVIPVAYHVKEFSDVAKVFEYASSIAAERKLDEQKLIESDERQRLALDAAAFATWDLDITSGNAVWSPRLYEFLGYHCDPSETATMEMWRDRIHPDDRQSLAAEHARAREQHSAAVSEYRIIRANTGEVRWLRSNGQYHYDKDGKPRRLVGVVRDVTERKLMEISLRESETQYRSALTVGRLGSWSTNYVTSERHWTPEAQALFGLSLPNGVGRVGGDGDELLRAVHPDDRSSFLKLKALAQTNDSFAAEYRIVRPGGLIVWLAGRGQVLARANDGSCARLLSVMADVTEQKKSEEHVRFLLREMSHRSKNLLAVVQSLAGQTMRSSASLAEFQTQFERRLQGLAASHDILVDQNWQGATLAHLVRRQLAPFVDPDSARVQIAGPLVDLNAAAAQTVGLALHELATNAVKYGGLSVPSGSVTVTWDFTDASRRMLLLEWIETGGPPVTAPRRKGFGHAVIERMAPTSIGGRVTLDYLPTGLHWSLTIPEAALSGEESRVSAVLTPTRSQTDSGVARR